MKNILWACTACFITISCGPQKSDNTQLRLAMEKRDSIYSQINSLQIVLRDLDKLISKLDTANSQYKRVKYVSATTLAPTRFVHYFQAHGIINAEKNILITPEVPGTVKTIFVKEGQKVVKGQSLIALDTKVIEGSIKEAATTFSLVRELYQRQEKLWNQNIGSEIQLLEAKNRKESIEERLNTLTAQKEKAIITAPASGVIDEILPKIGEMASPLMPVLRMVNLSGLYIKSDISENYLKHITKGDSVEIEFPSLELTTGGQIDQIGNFINPENRTFKIRVNLENNHDLYKPNLLAILRIMDFSKDSVIVVPSEYIMADANAKQYVFLVNTTSNQSRAHKVYVDIGQSYDGLTLIKAGLSGTETLITVGSRTVTDNEPITITE